MGSKWKWRRRSRQTDPGGRLWLKGSVTALQVLTMGFAVRVRSAGQKYGPTCHQRDRADVAEFVTLVRLSSLGQHVDVLALAGYKRRKSALTAGPIRQRSGKLNDQQESTWRIRKGRNLTARRRQGKLTPCQEERRKTIFHKRHHYPWSLLHRISGASSAAASAKAITSHQPGDSGSQIGYSEVGGRPSFLHLDP